MRQVALLLATFLSAPLAAAALSVGDPYLSSLLSHHTWQRLHLIDAPIKATLLIVLLLVLLPLALHSMRKAADYRSVLIVLITVAMQTNGIRFAGLDLLTLVPLVALLAVLAECMLRPATPLHVTGIAFFGMFILLLDLPHMADTNAYGPARFVINFVSTIRGMLPGLVLILLIENKRHLRLAIRALLVVAVLSAAIGVGQIVLQKFTGITFSLAPELRDTKPTFLGTMLRASGLTTWAQWLADFEILAVPFLLFALLRADTRRRKLAAWIGLAVVLGSVFFTFTYAAYVAVAVICVSFVFLAWPQRTLHILLGGLLVGTLFYMAGGWQWLGEQGLAKFAGSSGMVERKSYLLAALDQVVRDPWLGSGVYADEELSGNFYRKRVHNTGLQAWVYLGLPGFLVFIAMMLTTYAQLWLLAASRSGSVRQMFQCLALVMTGVIVTMFAQPNLTAPVTWYLLGLAGAAIRLFSAPAPTRYRPPAAPARPAAHSGG